MSAIKRKLEDEFFINTENGEHENALFFHFSRNGNGKHVMEETHPDENIQKIIDRIPQLRVELQTLELLITRNGSVDSIQVFAKKVWSLGVDIDVYASRIGKGDNFSRLLEEDAKDDLRKQRKAGVETGEQIWEDWKEIKTTKEIF